jgi:hypothetical protein
MSVPVLPLQRAVICETTQTLRVSRDGILNATSISVAEVLDTFTAIPEIASLYDGLSREPPCGFEVVTNLESFKPIGRGESGRIFRFSLGY